MLSISPMGDDHAGKVVFNNTTTFQMDSTAEQGRKIIRSRIQSVKNSGNSGLKIKLKGLHKNQNGPEDNPSNNINLFTQDAEIQSELRKKNYNTGEKNMIISKFEF
jgi:hypothetical protein